MELGGAEYLIRARSAGLSSAWGSRRDWTMALSFLYLAFVRILQLLRLHRSDCARFLKPRSVITVNRPGISGGSGNRRIRHSSESDIGKFTADEGQPC